MHWNPVAKMKPIRSKAYREFIRSIPCMICGGRSTPHHENFGESTMGGKKSDLCCLPICEHHHTLSTTSRHQHPLGWEAFYEKHNIDPKLKVIEYTNYFFAAGGKLNR